MTFVLQFASNQAICGKFLASDAAVAAWTLQTEEDGGADGAQAANGAPADDELRKKLAAIWDCGEEEIKISRENNDGGQTLTAEAPVRNVIACADFFGITPAENRTFYRRSVEKHEESDDNDGGDVSDDNAQ